MAPRREGSGEGGALPSSAAPTPIAALAALRAASDREGVLSLGRRRELLRALDRVLVARAEDVVAAAAADFGARSVEDTLLADVVLVLDAARYARRKLREWARPRRAPVPFPFQPARAVLEPVPKGVVGVMAPWNYPFQLALLPAVDAVAAGNRVAFKPSEATPRCSALLAEIVAEAWGPEVGLVVQGGPEVAREFAAQPWDHLAFTGGTETGRKVMAAAAANLTPLTLELGGKCPAVVLPGADLRRAARDILAAKFVNAGQTCVAPDTVILVGHDQLAFHAACRESGITGTETAVINAAQQARLDRITAGVTMEALGPERFPLKLATANGPLAEEEIFGPVLAVECVARLEEAVAWINARPAPLAIYLFGATRAEEAAVAASTKSGALVCDKALDHAAFFGMAFGGVGASGFGRRNGEWGFLEFSQLRARVRHGRWSLAGLFAPPRSSFARKLARRLAGLR
ncbi:MAG: aldehyde dehydrogenase family protein [Acetobacteraceae bacterium]|nr:aldehyde dehydrogenase family protein [Acetobacteraceae bacterium]